MSEPLTNNESIVAKARSLPDTVSLKTIVSLIRVDDDNILMPRSINHHWYQGDKDPKVEELFRKYFFEQYHQTIFLRKMLSFNNY